MKEIPPKVQYHEDTEGRKYAWLPPTPTGEHEEGDQLHTLLGKSQLAAMQPTGAWKQNGYCVHDENGFLFPCPTADDARSAVSFHNAALAAEREKAWDEGYCQGLVYNSPSALVQKQLDAAVEALKEAKARIISPTFKQGEDAYHILDAALAKIGGK